MCGPGFVGRVAEPSDAAGVAAVAAETGVALPDAEAYVASGRLLVAVSAGDVIGFLAMGEPDAAGAVALVGPAVGAAGVGLGVERALLRRAIEAATARGARALRAVAPAGSPLLAQALVAQGFRRTPEADAADLSAFTRPL